MQLINKLILSFISFPSREDRHKSNNYQWEMNSSREKFRGHEKFHRETHLCLPSCLCSYYDSCSSWPSAWSLIAQSLPIVHGLNSEVTLFIKNVILWDFSINKPVNRQETPWSRATQDNGISVEALFTFMWVKCCRCFNGMLSVYTGTERAKSVGTDSVSYASSLPQIKSHCQLPFSPDWFW